MTLWLIRLFQLDEGRRSSPSFDVAQATAAARIEQWHRSAQLCRPVRPRFAARSAR